VASARNDHVGVSLAWLDEFQMHRLNGRQVLLDDLVEWTAPYVRVALDPANESDVCVRVDEHLHVTELADTVVDEEQDPVDDDHVCRLDPSCLVTPEMRDEVVLGFLDCLALAQRFEVRTEQVVVERIRVIPVQLAPLVQRQRREILVIRVHVDERDGRCSQKIRDVSGDRRFARPRPAGDSNNQRLEHPAPKLRRRCMERIMPPSEMSRTAACASFL